MGILSFCQLSGDCLLDNSLACLVYVLSTGLFEYLGTSSLVYRTTVCCRPGLSFRNQQLRSSTGHDGGCTSQATSRSNTLVLLLETSNSIVYIGLLVIQVVFLGVDDNHAVPYSSSDLFWLGTLDSHVGNQVTDITHQLLLGARRESLHSLVCWVSSLGIEVLP